MSLTAVVSLDGSITWHGAVGPAALTEYTVPVTSGHVTRIAAPEIGLAPTFPVIADVGTSVIPDFVRIAKFPAVPRSTGDGPFGAAAGTVMVAEPDLVPDVAVIVAVPADMPVATPVVDRTVPTVGLPEVQAAVLLMLRVVPSE